MMRCSAGWLIATIATFACSGEVDAPSPDGGSDSDGGAQLVCPPGGPYGVTHGEVAPNIALYDCDGAKVHLHDLCPSNAAYLYTHAGWCGTCKLFVQNGEANDLFDTYKNDGLAMWFVITATESGYPPTTETCRAYREQYGLQMTVLIDPDGVTASALDMLPNSDDMVLSQGNRIELKGSYAPEAVEKVLDSLFAH